MKEFKHSKTMGKIGLVAGALLKHLSGDCIEEKSA